MTVTVVSSVGCPVAGSTNLAGYCALGVTASGAVPSPSLSTSIENLGVFVCGLPWISVDSSGVPLISFGVTVGM